MVHHALMVLAGVVRVSGATRSGGGVAVYIIQYCGRGAVSAVSVGVHPQRLIRRESVEVAYRQLGGRVSKIVASDASMCSYFVERCGASCPPPVLKEVYDALEESHVVVVVSRALGAKVRVLLPDRLKAREGIGGYADPFLVLECGESRIFGD